MRRGYPRVIQSAPRRFFSRSSSDIILETREIPRHVGMEKKARRRKRQKRNHVRKVPLRVINRAGGLARGTAEKIYARDSLATACGDENN